MGAARRRGARASRRTSPCRPRTPPSARSRGTTRGIRSRRSTPSRSSHAGARRWLRSRSRSRSRAERRGAPAPARGGAAQAQGLRRAAPDGLHGLLARLRAGLERGPRPRAGAAGDRVDRALVAGARGRRSRRSCAGLRPARSRTCSSPTRRRARARARAADGRGLRSASSAAPASTRSSRTSRRSRSTRRTASRPRRSRSARSAASASPSCRGTAASTSCRRTGSRTARTCGRCASSACGGIIGPNASGALTRDARARRVRRLRPVRRPHERARATRSTTGPRRRTSPPPTRTAPICGACSSRRRGELGIKARDGGTVVVDPGPALLDPRRVAVVPGDGLGGDQHDRVPRGLARARARALLREHLDGHRLRRRRRGRGAGLARAVVTVFNENNEKLRELLFAAIPKIGPQPEERSARPRSRAPVLTRAPRPRFRPSRTPFTLPRRPGGGAGVRPGGADRSFRGLRRRGRPRRGTGAPAGDLADDASAARPGARPAATGGLRAGRGGGARAQP